jgi:hypothetical protein
MNRRDIVLWGLLPATFLSLFSRSKEVKAQQPPKVQVAWIHKSGIILLTDINGSVQELEVPNNSNVIQVSGLDLKFSYPMEGRGLQNVPRRGVE